jgi:NitT/TauT family transport system permease protein
MSDTPPVAKRAAFSPAVILLPLAVAVLFLLGWHYAVTWSHSEIFPKPLQVLSGFQEIATKDSRGMPIVCASGQGEVWQSITTRTHFFWRVLSESLLSKHIVASLFRVSWGFILAMVVGVPLGLVLGWFRSAFMALNPFIQTFRPISPIAWIPVAIFWFGVKDTAPIFLIFLASVFPITVSAMAAVQNMQQVYLRAAQNFGLKGPQLFRRVIFPAALPQVITGIRIALGVAWLVVVAAEMIAVTSGLGYLIIDARNAGKRYDLVVAGMILIGVIGLLLDLLVRRLEKFDEVRWGYGQR